MFERRRILITGVERSGTSCVARVVDCLGVPIQSPGEYHSHVTMNPTGYYEDPKVNRWLEDANWSRIRHYIQQRRDCPLWGLKDPRLSHPQLMSKMWSCFSSDELVTVLVVRRDPKAIHQSWARCNNDRPLSEIEERLADLDKVAHATHAQEIHYESLINTAEEAVTRLADDLRLYTSSTQRMRAAHSVDTSLKHF